MAQSEVPYPFVGLASSKETVVVASSSTLHAINPSTASASSSTQTYTLPTSSTASTFIRLLAVSPDSRYAASISDDKGLRIYSLTPETITLDSTRYLTKKASDLTFMSETNDVLVSDKVGDCYLYPLIPKEIDASAEKLKKLDVQADPTLNPEATYLLGHVSVLTQHIFTEDRKHLITADRDEHIRITRYPDTFVIERYLFGTDGFVSAIHIPEGHPDLLISGGGEGILRLWNWRQGKQIGSVEIGDAILPYRAVRSTLRKDKRKNKGTKTKKSDDPFYQLPEGWMLPSGQGFLIRRISTLRIGNNIIVLFFSEGASAIHSFVFPANGDPSSTSSSTKIITHPTPFPVFEYTHLPGATDQILVSLDTTFSTVAFNQEAGQRPKKDTSVKLSEEQVQKAKKQFMVLQIGPDASIKDVTSSSSLVGDLERLAIYPDSSSTLSQLNLYPNLSLYPRWPGLEEDDDLAGPAADPQSQSQPTPSGSTPGAGAAPDTSVETTSVNVPLSSKNKKEYTQAEYSTMNLKTLGRLKSQGYDVDSFMRTKRRETKDRRLEAKRRRVDAGLSEPSKEEEEAGEELAELAEVGGVDVDVDVDEDEEEGGNA